MVRAHVVHPGTRVILKAYDPDENGGLNKDEGEERLRKLGDRLTDLQQTHFAAQAGGILIVLQALDTAGKDGTIKHVMTYFNPQACWVKPFGVPTPVEASHDFLWRAHRATPPHGIISVFNRSYYEDVLVVRVHDLAPESVWRRRYTHINNFESLLTDAGTTIIKFFLFISKDEQRERLLAREDDPDKAWKLSRSDWPEHERYGEYVRAYEDALTECSTEYAPWRIVPANHKWYRNLVVAQTLVDIMEPMEAGWRAGLEARGKEALQEIEVRPGTQ